MKGRSLHIASGIFKRKKIPLAKFHGKQQNATTGRVKEAAFQIIRNHIDISAPWVFYDLFAGSGQMGIEALSLGALHSTFVEILPERLSQIQRTLFELDIPSDRFTLVRNKSAKILPETFREDNLPSVVWADPPYSYGNTVSRDPAILLTLFTSTLAEMPPQTKPPIFLMQVHEKNPLLELDYLSQHPELSLYRYGSNCLTLFTLPAE